MMNIQELETKYAELGAEIKRLKQSDGVWEPQEGDLSWTIDSSGYCFTRIGSLGMDAHHHNFFKTRELAKKASVLQRRSNLVIQACLNFDPDFVADWSDHSQPKFGVSYNHLNGEWARTQHNHRSSSCAYVSTSLIADKVVAYLNSQGIK